MAQENPIFISSCPRCGIKKITFDVLASFRRYDWNYTLFCHCRGCFEGSTFDVQLNRSLPESQRELAGLIISKFCVKIEVQKPKFQNVAECPEFVPESVKEIFDEGATCRALGCYSASGAMFRKVIDQATRTLVDAKPGETNSDGSTISWKEFKDLRLRLNWLISNDKLPNGMDQLVECVREDGNDAAHALESIGSEGASDLEDFSKAILEFLFTMPGKISRNIDRRAGRRDLENKVK